jgi:hypothetical protein
MQLTFVIARRLGRARWLLTSSLTVVLAAVMVAAWYCILQAQSLTGEQIADRDLGVHGAYAGYGAGSIGPGSAAQAALAHRLARSRARMPRLRSSAPTSRPPRSATGRSRPSR